MIKVAIVALFWIKRFVYWMDDGDQIKSFKQKLQSSIKLETVWTSIKMLKNVVSITYFIDVKNGKFNSISI